MLADATTPHPLGTSSACVCPFLGPLRAAALRDSRTAPVMGRAVTCTREGEPFGVVLPFKRAEPF